MTEIGRALTQYGDLIGTIALDGYSGPFLGHLVSKAGMPAGRYFEVGLELGAEDLGIRGMESIWVSLLAVDTSVVGADHEAIRAFAGRNQTVPVVRFTVTLPFTELVALVKRCHIVVANRYLLGETPTVIQDTR